MCDLYSPPAGLFATPHHHPPPPPHSDLPPSPAPASGCFSVGLPHSYLISEDHSLTCSRSLTQKRVSHVTSHHITPVIKNFNFLYFIFSEREGRTETGIADCYCYYYLFNFCFLFFGFRPPEDSGIGRGRPGNTRRRDISTLLYPHTYSEEREVKGVTYSRDQLLVRIWRKGRS